MGWMDALIFNPGCRVPQFYQCGADVEHAKVPTVSRRIANLKSAFGVRLLNSPPRASCG